jgi:hypothetical protein
MCLQNDLQTLITIFMSDKGFGSNGWWSLVTVPRQEDRTTE